MNEFERICRIWMTGCSCSDLGNPEQCIECTSAFHAAVKRIANYSPSADFPVGDRCLHKDRAPANGLGADRFRAPDPKNPIAGDKYTDGRDLFIHVTAVSIDGKLVTLTQKNQAGTISITVGKDEFFHNLHVWKIF